jgi:hypothetical protein
LVTARVWRSPLRQASGKESGSFLKKRTKKLLQIQAEPLRKGRSQLRKTFCFSVSKKGPSFLNPGIAPTGPPYDRGSGKG